MLRSASAQRGLRLCAPASKLDAPVGCLRKSPPLSDNQFGTGAAGRLQNAQSARTPPDMARTHRRAEPMCARYINRGRLAHAPQAAARLRDGWGVGISVISGEWAGRMPAAPQASPSAAQLAATVVRRRSPSANRRAAAQATASADEGGAVLVPSGHHQSGVDLAIPVTES